MEAGVGRGGVVGELMAVLEHKGWETKEEIEGGSLQAV